MSLLGNRGQQDVAHLTALGRLLESCLSFGQEKIGRCRSLMGVSCSLVVTSNKGMKASVSKLFHMHGSF